MAMDFFESQDAARRRTGTLVLIFALAVLGIVALVYLVVAAAVHAFLAEDPWRPGAWSASVLWQPRVLAIASTATILLIGGATAYKLWKLRGGGRVIAAELGGRPLDLDEAEGDEQKLLNVVEEMAIASGAPVPPVYIFDREKGINAFAAGYDLDDAVIGVTRGAIEKLDRDQLQGVIAHEFSHILNGDMRINLRMIGIIHGVLAVSLAGKVVLYGGLPTADHDRDRDRDGFSPPLLAAGIALIVVGSLGALASKLIKAALSRQREFLADAAAVQFTRNPDGIAGALRAIAGMDNGARLRTSMAEEASHMFFGEGVGRVRKAGPMERAHTPSWVLGTERWISGWFSTHPPLTERIERIENRALSDAERESAAAIRAGSGEETAGVSGLAAGAGGDAAAADTAAAAAETSPVEAIGNPSKAHLARARSLAEGLPASVKQAVRRPEGARAALYALLLEADESLADKQIAHVRKHDGDDAAERLSAIRGDVASVDPAARLPLVDLALPALKRAPAETIAVFRKVLTDLARADRRIDPFEWTLHQIALQHLGGGEESEAADRARSRAGAPELDEAARVVLTTLALVGAEDAQSAAAAFAAGAAAYGNASLAMADRDACGLTALARALRAWRPRPARERKRLLSGACACIARDEAVTLREGELLRAVADALGCPMPPILPGQKIRVAASSADAGEKEPASPRG